MKITKLPDNAAQKKPVEPQKKPVVPQEVLREDNAVIEDLVVDQEPPAHGEMYLESAYKIDYPKIVFAPIEIPEIQVKPVMLKLPPRLKAQVKRFAPVERFSPMFKCTLK